MRRSTCKNSEAVSIHLVIDCTGAAALNTEFPSLNQRNHPWHFGCWVGGENMKPTRRLASFYGLVILGTACVHAQSGGGVGGGQSGGTQTFPSGNPPASTESTPKAAAASGTVPGSATTSTPADAAPAVNTPNSNPKVGTMSTIVVTGTNNSVLPADQTVTSAYGTNLSIQDTPRNVTVVNSQLLQDANISSLSDFVKVAPSAYTTDQYGVANVPHHPRTIS